MRIQPSLEARGITSIVATGLLALAGGTGAASAAPTVSVVAVPKLDRAAFAARGAIGLYVPGSGPRASRAGAIASLERGRIENSVLGGVPSGRRLITLSRHPGRVTIFVALPP